jgi:transposase
MPSPLSVDLRERVVATYENGDGSYRDVARQFSVGEASVNRWVNQFRRTGRVVPRPARGGKRRELEGEKLDAVQVLVLEQADRTEQEIAQALAAIHAIHVSRSTVSRALARLGLSRKKSPSPPANGTASGSTNSEKNSSVTSSRRSR